MLLRTIDDYWRIDAPVIYHHPLAYLLGLEGIALLRAFSGLYDRDFTLARLREIQELSTHAGEPPRTWSLHPWATAATNAAYRGTPIAIVWHFQLSGALAATEARS